jgi:hypothetical protein
MIEAMKSPIFVLILIVNLLTCPLSCIASKSQSAFSVGDACACCDCCSNCEEVPASDDSQPHDEDSSGKSCICKGAVVSNPVELPDLEHAVSWALPIQLVIPVSSHSTAFLGNHLFEHSEQILSGRDAHIAHQSLQI